jgi:hypothetical protein
MPEHVDAAVITTDAPPGGPAVAASTTSLRRSAGVPRPRLGARYRRGSCRELRAGLLAYRRISAQSRKGITLNSIMSFPEIALIWLAVLFAAYVSGWVAHIMNRRTRNLPGVSYHAPTDPAAARIRSTQSPIPPSASRAPSTSTPPSLSVIACTEQGSLTNFS